MKITNSGIDTYDVRDVTVQRLNVNVRLVHSGTIDADLNKVKMNLTLKRQGKTHIIFASSLAVLVKESMYFEQFLATFPTANANAHTMAANTYMLPLTIDLGSPINVKNDDLLSLEVDAQSGWMGTATASSCFIDFLWREKIGIEYHIPQIIVKAVRSGAGEFIESLGDNIISLAWINIAKTTYPTDSTKVIENFVIDSDKYRIQDNVDRMLARRATQFGDLATASLRGFCFKYVPETEIDDVQANITLSSSNVAVNENYFVTRSLKLDNYTLERAQDFERKHYNRDARKLSKFGISEGVVNKLSQAPTAQGAGGNA